MMLLALKKSQVFFIVDKDIGSPKVVALNLFLFFVWVFKWFNDKYIFLRAKKMST